MIHYTWFVSFFFSQRKVMLIKSIRDLFIYTDEENMQKNREKRNKKRFFLVIIDEENRIKSQIHLL